LLRALRGSRCLACQRSPDHPVLACVMKNLRSIWSRTVEGRIWPEQKY
jgi:hypothetical protein